jgi:hypothetical protein
VKPLQLVLLMSCALLGGRGQDAVNAGAAAVHDFEKRVAEYQKLRKTVEAKLPPLKSTSSSEKISVHESELAVRIRELRRSARQGDLFTPEISAEFRRLIGMTMQGQNAARIKATLKSAETVRLRLGVNDAYPANVPLQTTPPTLLANLPRLPPEVDYRLVGRDLVLRDAKANLIVDFIANAIPGGSVP